jgi:uncharacterized protein YjiS (DUF1127 family)
MISDWRGHHLPAVPRLHLGLHRLTKLQWSRVINVWIQRNRQRHQLANLDDRMLWDIGVTRAQAARECAKPFWRH